MKPLEGFTASADEIAHGNFDAILPQIKSQDEMKELYDSFSYMQHSLTSYISELKVTTASKERIQSELNIAHQIQMGMIPKIFPPFPERDDVDLYAMLKPAKEVGGDLYDFFILDDKLYFVIGDVSGKGVPASLFMAVTRSLFRNIARSSETPAEIISGINDSISEQNESNMFVTLFMGILDLSTGMLSYCNGGHNPPVLISADGKAKMMDIKKNVVVGIISGFDYVDEEIQLESGAKLFCYTDGVVEAENAEKELYSEDRLLTTLEVHSKYGVRRLTEQVLESVSEHVLMAEQSDDITIMVVNYK
jgi:sigma-B regulation protein RsbU (phosphoserine phosphatase)